MSLLTLLSVLTLLIVLTSTAYVAAMTVRDALERRAVKSSIRRAFPARYTAYEGQQCTATGTRFADLSQSMLA